MSMERYCVMGNPVAHSKSPWIHGRFAELTAQPVEYGRLLVHPGEFRQAVQAFRDEGGRGCNVTMPYKFEAAAYATAPTRRAQLAQACNTLRFDNGEVIGDNTDGIGLVTDIVANAGVPLAGRDLLLIGAGGAAAGVLGPLIEAKPRQVLVANRTPERAAILIGRHTVLARRHAVKIAATGLDAVKGGFDVVINATATSLNRAGVPVPASVLKPGALACDLMYGTAAYPFLDWAVEHGAVPRDGLGMLVEQAAESFLLWRGVRPPSAQVLNELRVKMDEA